MPTRSPGESPSFSTKPAASCEVDSLNWANVCARPSNQTASSEGCRCARQRSISAIVRIDAKPPNNTPSPEPNTHDRSDFVIASGAKQSRGLAEELDCVVAIVSRNDDGSDGHGLTQAFHDFFKRNRRPLVLNFGDDARAVLDLNREAEAFFSLFNNAALTTSSAPTLLAPK